MKISFLILTFSLILFGAHAILGVSMVQFLGIHDPGRRIVLAVTLTVLSLSFIASSMLVHFYENFLTRAIYLFSGFWLGLLTYLVLFSLLLWCIVWGTALFDTTRPDVVLLAIIFFVGSLGLSIYGIWNAFHPKITEVSVSLPHLPDVWKGKRIVQLSDVHLGSIYRADFLRGVIQQVNALHPEIVVITGDLFDGIDGQLENLIAPFDDLYAEQGTYFITGNHETYLGSEYTSRLLAGKNIRVLNDEVVDISGLALIGIGYPERGVPKDMRAIMQSLRPAFLGKPNILLFHSPTNLDIFKSFGVNLQLSGHTHLGQIFPFQYITNRVYRGHDYGLYRDGEYALYTTNGVGTWGPAMRIGNTPEIVVFTLNAR